LLNVTSRKKIFVSVSLLAVLGLGAWMYWGRADTSGAVNPARLDITEVDRGSIVQSIRATGQLSPVREVQVGSQISGIITELFADFNTEVERGMVIAKLDTSTYEANVALAQAELRGAEAMHELARLREERVRPLREQELLPQAELEEAIAMLRQAAAQVDIRRSNLHKARVELDRCYIVSPTDGIVISRNVDVGQTVAASLSAPVLFEIADDLTQMEIIANVPEADVGDLRVDQRVEFQVDAYRDRRFVGEVVQIRNAPRIIDNVVTYDTVVRVDNSDLLLKPGMTAEVFIITRQVDDALRVRNSALRARLPNELRPSVERPAEVPEKARPVFVHVAAGTIETRWVTTGITDGVYTEIVTGAEPGLALITGFRLQRADENNRRGSLLGGQQATY
jgi:HlyD family secretion protein